MGSTPTGGTAILVTLAYYIMLDREGFAPEAHPTYEPSQLEEQSADDTTLRLDDVHEKTTVRLRSETKIKKEAFTDEPTEPAVDSVNPTPDEDVDFFATSETLHAPVDVKGDTLSGSVKTGKMTAAEAVQLYFQDDKGDGTVRRLRDTTPRVALAASQHEVDLGKQIGRAQIEAQLLTSETPDLSVEQRKEAILEILEQDMPVHASSEEEVVDLLAKYLDSFGYFQPSDKLRSVSKTRSIRPMGDFSIELAGKGGNKTLDFSIIRKGQFEHSIVVSVTNMKERTDDEMKLARKLSTRARQVVSQSGKGDMRAAA